MKLYEYSATELSGMLREKKVSAEEIARETMARIAAVEPKVDAFLTVTEEEALRQAAAVDADIAAGRPIAPLAGIPVAVKDNICTKDILTTCASRMLENFVPPYNATVVEKLMGQGAVIAGKTNMDEMCIRDSSHQDRGYAAARVHSCRWCSDHTRTDQLLCAAGQQ